MTPVIALLTLSLAGAPTARGALDTMVTLSGEHVEGSARPPVGSAQLNCSNPGTGSANYTVVGTAIGPYPGTYTETGSVTFFDSQIQSFEASFTIDAGATQIQGSRHLGTPATMTCDLGPITTASASFAGRYDATITSPAGTLSDHGVIGTGLFFEVIPTEGTIGSVGGNFFSDRETAHVEASPTESVNVVGTTHTVSVFLRDAQLQPLAGGTILFTVEGSVTDSGHCTTGSDGTCSFTYTGPSAPGADVITACYDFDDDGAVDPGERCSTVTKAWIDESPAPGRATGGGYFTTVTGNRVVFGLGAVGGSSGPQGGCDVIDQLAGVRIHCLSVSLVGIIGTHATVSGEALQNGVATNYTIDVDDLANPGALSDTFTIRTDAGYIATGTLEAGNIVVNPGL